jgi:glycosyltransferase involved in cell wall biosynthesis
MVTARALPFVGGIETHVEEVSSRIARAGVDLTVLTTDVTGALESREERDGFVIRRFPAWPRSKDYFVSPGLLMALGRGNFDVVHVQGVHNTVAPLALAVAHRRKVPAIVTFHTGGNSSATRNALRGAQWRAERPLLVRAEKLIAVCEFEAALFSRALRITEDRIVLIRNGSERLPESPVAPDFSGAPLILSVGRLERYKGHHRVIAAMPALLAHAPRARLVVVGRGEFEPVLRDMVSTLDLDAIVSIVSYAAEDRALMGALVRSANVVTLMSEYEAHPVAVMEALAEGIDVVVADTSGLSELGREGLVTTIDLGAPPETLADALLVASQEHRWAAGPPALPTWDDCAEALIATYREVARCGS